MSRTALLSPHAAEHEASRDREQPSNLHDLVRWFREAWESEMPTRLHSRDTDAGGSPDWHGEFKAYLTASVYAIDEEGSARRPMAVHWTRWSNSTGRDASRARFLYTLVCKGYSVPNAWQALKGTPTELGAVARDDFAYRTLARFWEVCQTPPRVYPPRPKEDRKGALSRVGKSEAQHHAEEDRPRAAA